MTLQKLASWRASFDLYAQPYYTKPMEYTSLSEVANYYTI